MPALDAKCVAWMQAEIAAWCRAARSWLRLEQVLRAFIARRRRRTLHLARRAR
jgi:hypothetical protein